MACLAMVLFTATTAQAATLTGGSDGIPITPDADPITVDITLTMACDEYLPAGGGPDGLEVPLEAQSSHQELLVEGPITLTVQPGGCMDAGNPQASGAVPFEISATRSAPGLRSLTIQFDAQIPDPSGTSMQQPAPLDVVAVVDAYFSIKVEAPEPIQRADRGDDLAYDAVITNLGNTPIRAMLQLTEGDSEVIELPDPPVIGSSAYGQANNVTIQIVSTSSERGLAQLAVSITPVAEMDSSKQGETISLSLVERRGTPGFGWSPMVWALLVAGLIAAKHRRPPHLD